MRIKAFLAFLCLLSAFFSIAEEAHPPLTPSVQLFAEFMKNTRCPVFERSDDVSLWIRIAGRRYIDDTIIWRLCDREGTPLGNGSIPVPKGDGNFDQVIKLPGVGCGYFEVRIKLDLAGISIPMAGTRPEGFVSYAVMAPVERLPLKHVDDSRFGAQGTNYIKSGIQLKGDFVDPVYPVMGIKWIYRGRRLAELAQSNLSDYKPCLDPVKMAEHGKDSCERAAGLCFLVDASYLPAWLMKIPEGISSANLNGQAYPPNDYAKYEEFIGKIAAEQVLNREINFPNQRRNYYEIHWEPDWHWKGTDEEFIKMYEHAYKAIHENDPDGMLLGANYGVLTTGNKHLERLFEKGLGKYLDGIVTHTYFLPEFQNPEKGNLIQDMRKLVALKDKFLKPQAPLINSEWCTNYGSSPVNKYHGSISAESAEIHGSLNSEAARFMRGHLIALGEGADATFYFYTADDSFYGMGLFYNLTYPNPVCGATNISPKPVMVAAALATRLLEGTKNLGSLEYLADGVWGYAFDRDGTVAAAIWSVDDKDREISLPVGADKVTVFDPMGNSASIRAENGFAKVKVGTIPSYVLGISKAAIPSAIKCNPARLSVLPGDLLKVDGDAKFSLIFPSTCFDLGQGPDLKIPRGASSGKCLLVERDAADGHWLSSSILELKAPAFIELAGSSVKVDNVSKEELKGVLSVSAPEAEPILKSSLSIPVLGSVNIPLDLGRAGSGLAADSELILKFTDSYGSESTVKRLLRNSYYARKAMRPPSMDGSLSDWQLELFKTVSSSEDLKINPDGESVNDADLSFRFAFQYDENALYFAVKVRDQTHVQEQPAADSWKEDSVQLGVALHPETSGGWKFFHKFCFAKSSKDGAILSYRHNGTPDLPAGRLSSQDVKVNVSRSGDETFYLVAIPWQSLDKSLKSFPEERRIGIGVFVNDVDLLNGQKTKRKAMEAFGGLDCLGTIRLE